MIVKFNYDSSLCWHTERILYIPDNTKNSDIEMMFKDVLGVDFNVSDCWYNILTNNDNSKDVYSYTE